MGRQIDLRLPASFREGDPSLPTGSGFSMHHDGDDIAAFIQGTGQNGTVVGIRGVDVDCGQQAK